MLQTQVALRIGCFRLLYVRVQRSAGSAHRVLRLLVCACLNQRRGTLKVPSISCRVQRRALDLRSDSQSWKGELGVGDGANPQVRHKRPDQVCPGEATLGHEHKRGWRRNARLVMVIHWRHGRQQCAERINVASLGCDIQCRTRLQRGRRQTPRNDHTDDRRGVAAGWDGERTSSLFILAVAALSRARVHAAFFISADNTTGVSPFCAERRQQRREPPMAVVVRGTNAVLMLNTRVHRTSSRMVRG